MTSSCHFLEKNHLKLTSILQRNVQETWFLYQKLCFELQINIKQLLEVPDYFQMPQMLKNHDLGVILAPTSHLVNLIFCTNFKILPPKMFFGYHRCQDLLIKSKICVLNLFKIMMVDIPMSRFCYILAAIDAAVIKFKPRKH